MRLHSLHCNKRLVKCDQCNRVMRATDTKCGWDSVQIDQIHNLTPCDTRNKEECWCETETFPDPKQGQITVRMQEPSQNLYVALASKDGKFTAPQLYRTSDNTIYLAPQRLLDKSKNEILHKKIMIAFGKKRKHEDETTSSGRYSGSAELAHMLGHSEKDCDAKKGSTVVRGDTNSPFSSTSSEQKLYDVSQTSDQIKPEDKMLDEDARANTRELEGIESNLLPTFLDIFDDNVHEGKHVLQHVDKFAEFVRNRSCHFATILQHRFGNGYKTDTMKIHAEGGHYEFSSSSIDVPGMTQSLASWFYKCTRSPHKFDCWFDSVTMCIKHARLEEIQSLEIWCRTQNRQYKTLQAMLKTNTCPTHEAIEKGMQQACTKSFAEPTLLDANLKYIYHNDAADLRESYKKGQTAPQGTFKNNSVHVAKRGR